MQDWYPNEKMVVVPVCLNGGCCSSGCMGIVVLTKIKAMSLCFSWIFKEMLSMQFFLEYLKESKLSSSHDVYDDTKHY